MTASVGVALFDDLSEGEMLALADAAMYAAKDAGRDRFVVFDPSDPRRQRSRQAGEASRLRRALADERFVLHCQPVWNLAERRVETYELLIRMRDETDGTLIAAERVPLRGRALRARSRRSIRWVVTQAVRADRRARRAQGRRLVLFVNLSGRSIGDPAVDAHIDRGAARRAGSIRRA